MKVKSMLAYDLLVIRVNRRLPAVRSSSVAVVEPSPQLLDRETHLHQAANHRLGFLFRCTFLHHNQHGVLSGPSFNDFQLL